MTILGMNTGNILNGLCVVKDLLNQIDLIKLIGTLNNKGYIIVDSNSTKAHTVIMEYLLRRNLKKGEIIDHINTIKTDNSFSNLRVTDQKGNMNNVNTLEKLSEKIVLADLYGDFLNFVFREISRN